MSNHRNELMDLHYAPVAGRVLGGARPRHGVALEDAEPEAYEERQSVLRRLAAAVRVRRDPAVATPKRA
jgi:hypothetical protein